MAAPRRLPVIVNPSSGPAERAASVRRVAAALAAAGIEADLQTTGDAGELTARVREAVAGGAPILAVAGGDGSQSAAAGVLAGTGTALAVLPTGTLNHFARDLGLPVDDLDAVARIIAAGRTARIDVGDLEGRVFLNNSSLGLYPRIVDLRREEEEEGRGRRLALLWATARVVLRRHPHLHVAVEVEGERLERKTHLVFVGNNEYAVEARRLGRRDRLDAGCLSVYVARRSGRWPLVRVAVLGLLGRLPQTPELETWRTDAVTVETRRHSVRVARDGEVERMEPPLRYRIRARELEVVVPAGRERA